MSYLQALNPSCNKIVLSSSNQACYASLSLYNVILVYKPEENFGNTLEF